MKPLRKYAKATIWFRDHVQPDGEYFEVCVYSSVLIYFDGRGKEHTVPMVFVKEVIEYAEDRVAPEPPLPMPDPANITQPPLNPDAPREVRKIQTPKGGKAYHV